MMEDAERAQQNRVDALDQYEETGNWSFQKDGAGEWQQIITPQQTRVRLGHRAHHAELGLGGPIEGNDADGSWLKEGRIDSDVRKPA